MDNYAILQKYRKKLSIYFALFILLSLWVAQGIFLVIVYTSNNIDLNNKSNIKLSWVVNVLENKDEYSERIANNDTTLEKLVEKSLEWVTILKNWELELWNLEDYELLWNKNFASTSGISYYKFNSLVNNKNYEIVIKMTNLNSVSKLFLDFLNFALISLVFLIFFYYVWYFFVWRNFRPIRETISSLESFSANINHEMKTPLAEIISTLDLAKQTGTNYEHAIDQSLKSSHKLDKILDSMLWIINLVKSSYSREKIDLVADIKNIILENSPKIKEKNIEIGTDFKNKSYSKKINKQYFRICVNNIITNAIKYSHNDSIINITFDSWVLEVEDFWIWIDKDNLKQIFSRFFREDYNKEKWLWIGLSLVKKIVDLHWWKIEIDSEKWKFTKVKISFL